MSKLPSPETMLTYASILEKPQYHIDKQGRKFLLPTGEIVEAACAALRFCAALPRQKTLSDFTDAEIANERHYRAMKFLGSQSEGVTFPALVPSKGDGGK